jgi:transcriptional regulator GlxA family with amidase domain
MLAETSQLIHELARTVGFVDELYFSRRFPERLSTATRNYRKAY